MKNYKFLCGLIISGIIGGLVSTQFITILLQYIGEYDEVFSFNYVVFLGLLTSISLFCISMGTKYLRNYILQFLIFLGIFSGLYLLEDFYLIILIFLSLSFSLWIFIGADIFSSFSKSFIKKNFLSIIGAGIGGGTGGIFISLAYVLRINFSIDEGYFILTAFLLSSMGAILGITISTSIFAWNLGFKNKANLFLENNLTSKKIIPIILTVILLFSITTLKYWETMDLNSNYKYTPLEHNEIFTSHSLLKTSLNIDEKKSIYTKEDLVKFLKNRSYKNPDTLSLLYLLTDEEKLANEFKYLLINEAENKKFLGISGSVKAWQYAVAIRVYYFSLVTQKNPELFNDIERRIILEWFKELNEEAYRVTWPDYIYAFLFKKAPDGFYENQEIGAGFLSVMAEVLEEEYPELAERNRKYLEKLGVGWKGNFRNPDDGITYPHTIWIKNAYMLGKFGGQEEYITSENARNSFEWILAQWPPNGMSPAYNVPLVYAPYDVMILGSSIFNDGRYKWLAEKMLEWETKNNLDWGEIGDYSVGAHLWSDELESLKPDIGSVYIQGTTGIAQNPGPLKPDKIVFRDGWESDSLYTLLNLRYSGWHSYKATNSIISIMYGEPFVVEELPLKNHSWLPKGKADFRDKKIDRTMLNTFQIENTGLERVIYKLIGFGSSWSQDPPRFAEVVLFNSIPIADYSVTEISDWHGWTHKRASFFVKDEDSFLVVFDYAKGKNPKKVGVTWHFKGNAKIMNQSIKLSQGNYSSIVYYPHSEDWYKTKIFENKGFLPAGEIHNTSLDFWMISEDKSEVGFITIFYPERNITKYEVKNIKVFDNQDSLGYPNFMGVEITKNNQTYVIGIQFLKEKINYEGLENDNIVIIYKFNNQELQRQKGS